MNELNENENKGGGFWLGLAIGGLVGAVTSYFALTDDKQRRKLLKKGKAIIEGLEDFGGDVVDRGEEIKDQVSDKIEGVSEVVEEKKPQVTKATKKAVKQIKAVASDAVEKIEDVAEGASDTAVGIKKSVIKKFFFRKGKPLVKK